MLQKFPLYAYIPAQDVPRARQFYEGKLGFKAGQQQNGDHHGCVVEPGFQLQRCAEFRFDTDSPQHREHGGGVGTREHGAPHQRGSPVEMQR